jgi:hypothetical protein
MAYYQPPQKMKLRKWKEQQNEASENQKGPRDSLHPSNRSILEIASVFPNADKQDKHPNNPPEYGPNDHNIFRK